VKLLPLLLERVEVRRMKSRLYLFSLIQSNHVGLSLPNIWWVNGNPILAGLSLWRRL